MQFDILNRTTLAFGILFSGSMNAVSQADPVDLICSGTIVETVNSIMTPHVIDNYPISVNFEKNEINDKLNNCIYNFLYYTDDILSFVYSASTSDYAKITRSGTLNRLDGTFVYFSESIARDDSTPSSSQVVNLRCAVGAKPKRQF